jgi:SAM-dependent methyltransferase
MDWSARLDEMLAGYRPAAMVMAAVRTGLFDTLADGPLEPAEAADRAGLSPRAVDILMHGLAAIGILHKQGEAFALDAGAAPLLLSGSPDTMTSIIGHNLSLLRAWSHLDTVLQTGAPPPRSERSEQEMRDFILGMENISRRSSEQVADTVDLSGARRLLDLGGGPGTAALVFARRWPDLHCVVFDLPGPVAIAAEQIARAGLGDRVTTLAGDFHADHPGTGYDVVYVSNIIHMMGDDETAALLRICARALVPGGRILLKDFYLDDDRVNPAAAAVFSVNMLAATERGRSYTRRETEALLSAAGFGAVTAHPVARHSLVLEARLA